MDRPGTSGVQKSNRKHNLSLDECVEILNDSCSELEIDSDDSFFSEDDCRDDDVIETSCEQIRELGGESVVREPTHDSRRRQVSTSETSDSDDSDIVSDVVDNGNVRQCVRGRGRVRTRSGRRGRGRGVLRGGVSRRGFQTRRTAPTDEELGWSETDNTLQNIVYTGNQGLSATSQIKNNSSPLETFSAFFSEDIIRKIKTETNTYARQQIAEATRRGPLPKNSVHANWRMVTITDIKIFLAIIMHMSLVRKPRIRDYWSKKPIYDSGYASSLRMSRDRFSAILTMLHLNNNDSYIPRGNPGHDPLHKVRPILDQLFTSFGEEYVPSEELTIDEGICGFRGRVRFRVFIKGKPEKYGMKIYEICEARSGYTCGFEVYTGKDLLADENVNSALNVVDRLSRPYQNKGHTIYMDRYFSSPKVFNHLWEQGTKAVGTVMPNREGMPKQTFQKQLKRGEHVSRRRNSLLAIKWRDVRDVYMLSTVHKDEMKVDQRRREGKIKPAAVIDYNKFKVGVDRSDQLLAYYAYRRRQVKWWKKLFMHLLDLAIVNASIVYNSCHPQKLRLQIFIEELAGSLVASAGLEDIEPRPGPSQQEGRLLPGNHFPYKIPTTTGSIRAAGQKKCRVCAERGKRTTGKIARKDTSIMCKQCDVPLCIGECFEMYHKKEKYWE